MDKTVVDTSDWKTYRNEEYGFDVKYPSDLELKEESDKITFNFDIKNYFRTKLASETYLTLYKPTKTCTSSQGDLVKFTSNLISQNGVAFSKSEWSGVGAGQLYRGLYYTNTKDGKCYVVELFTHSANGAGFFTNDQDEIKKLDALHAEDMKSIFNLADKIVSTFKFTR